MPDGARAALSRRELLLLRRGEPWARRGRGGAGFPDSLYYLIDAAFPYRSRRVGAARLGKRSDAPQQPGRGGDGQAATFPLELPSERFALRADVEQWAAEKGGLLEGARPRSLRAVVFPVFLFDPQE
jgi:hypothetical protein